MNAELTAATFWLGFHLRRNVRKRPFVLWAAGIGIGLVLLKFGARMPAEGVGALVVLGAAPLMSLFYGAGAMREEIEDQTLTYSFSRPVGRQWLYAARVLAAIGPVAAIAIPAAFFAGTGFGGEPLRYAFGAALATLAYGSFFALAGELIKWPTWFGLAFLVFWEGGVGMVPGFLGRLTLLTQLRGVTGIRPEGGPLTAWWEAPDPVGSAVALVAVAAVTLWLGGQIVRRREFVLTK
jgi:hypothetical protein